MSERRPVAEFNDLSPAAAAAVLTPMCACVAWQRVLVASRPFGAPGELTATSDGVIGALGWSDVEEALAAEPEAVPPAVRGSEEAIAYEARFGVPFVVEPTGKTAEQIRAALAERLAADEETERRSVRRELAAIVRVRLAKTFV